MLEREVDVSRIARRDYTQATKRTVKGRRIEGKGERGKEKGTTKHGENNERTNERGRIKAARKETRTIKLVLVRAGLRRGGEARFQLVTTEFKRAISRRAGSCVNGFPIDLLPVS